MEIRTPKDHSEWGAYSDLRNSVLLRVGYNENALRDKIDAENGRAYHLAVFFGNYVVSVGRVHMIKEVAQISHLATAREYQGKSYGSQVLNGLEQFALANGGARTITIETPQSAIEFFRKKGYSENLHEPNKGKKLKFGRIPFQAMEKRIRK